MDFSKISLTFGMHREKEVIWLAFEYNKDLINEIKQLLPTAKWSSTQKKWHVPDDNAVRDLLHLPMKEYMGKRVMPRLSFNNQAQLQRMMDELRLRAYGEPTIRTYSVEVAQLMYLLKEFPIQNLTSERLRAYLLYCFEVEGISVNQMHSRLNALKFYFEKVLGRDKFFMEIPRPQKPSSLPKVFSEKDIERLFEVIDNQKHRLMLQLCYGMGLRVSEVVRLKIADIDSGRMLVFINNGKGKKDRYVPLPESILDDLRSYYREYKPNIYLFEGANRGQYAIRSVQGVFHTAKEKAKIRKKVGIHGLRHSYATHLLEYGTDMSFIQKLLGHNNIKTTEVYAKVSNTHLAKVKSPLDRMKKS
ncbi:tyrosine-type recombinase/integrase [Rhizosphaericola mali]|uniref:Tyrosine-type recombinase/integrase n=1 Tax=Rhizosphaericola mali TaxID=2545455 RepID=A0A5P2GBL4_9BACT|nr:tyrosine-type recombinase/integrase [Rhizosphaericola mali]QES90603.1 tyrosine-type recombinase/integrase [Rhizosphaericola mali]